MQTRFCQIWSLWNLELHSSDESDYNDTESADVQPSPVNPHDPAIPEVL